MHKTSRLVRGPLLHQPNRSAALAGVRHPPEGVPLHVEELDPRAVVFVHVVDLKQNLALAQHAKLGADVIRLGTHTNTADFSAQRLTLPVPLRVQLSLIHI